MSFDTAIHYGKEHRRPYRKSARFDATCRHGGSCPRCRGNRTRKNELRRMRADEAITEFLGAIDKRLWEKWKRDIETE